MPHYDVIVLGAGGVGSAALMHVARRGAKALALDRFPPGHDRGSSHGQTRIIRQAYFEHAHYVPLLRRAYKLWAELEQARGEQLFFRTGLLQVGPAEGLVVPGVLRSATEHGLNVEQLSREEIETRFPGFAVPENCVGVFEGNAGYLRVEECVLAHAAEAARAGAEIRAGEEVRAWRVEGGAVVVETSLATYTAARLIITAGAWASELLHDLGVKLRVLQKHLYWFANTRASYEAQRGCPAYLFELPHGVFYGFPQVNADGVKVAEHSGGNEVANPLTQTREENSHDRARVSEFVKAYMPLLEGPVNRHASCLYTMSADEHFIVDRHLTHEQVVFACGLSGHGFKFTCVLGEALADMALNGRSQLPIEFLGLSRPALRPG